MTKKRKTMGNEKLSLCLLPFNPRTIFFSIEGSDGCEIFVRIKAPGINIPVRGVWGDPVRGTLRETTGALPPPLQFPPPAHPRRARLFFLFGFPVVRFPVSDSSTPSFPIHDDGDARVVKRGVRGVEELGGGVGLSYSFHSLRRIDVAVDATTVKEIRGKKGDEGGGRGMKSCNMSRASHTHI